MSSLHALQQQSVRINQKISRFLDKIELHFVQMPNVYNRFLDTLEAFNNQQWSTGSFDDPIQSRIEAPRAIERVSDLFAAHEDLVLEFHALSEYQSGDLEADDQSQESAAASNRERAVPKFLNRLATRYTNDISVFQRFHDTMQDSINGLLDISGLQSGVADLLANDADLMAEFHRFLPPEQETVYAAKYDPASERDFKGEWWAI
ncbi:MAG: hypothetical protein Q9205_005923 [Flavoplaca limonia]